MLVHSNDVGSPVEGTVSENTLCRIELVQGVIVEYYFLVEASWRSVQVRFSALFELILHIGPIKAEIYLSSCSW